MLDVRHLPTKTQIVFSRSNLTGLSPLKLSTSENRCNSNLIYSSIPSSSWSLRVWVSPTRARHRGGAPTTRNHLHSLFQSMVMVSVKGWVNLPFSHHYRGNWEYEIHATFDRTVLQVLKRPIVNDWLLRRWQWLTITAACGFAIILLNWVATNLHGDGDKLPAHSVSLH